MIFFLYFCISQRSQFLCMNCFDELKEVFLNILSHYELGLFCNLELSYEHTMMTACVVKLLILGST